MGMINFMLIYTAFMPASALGGWFGSSCNLEEFAQSPKVQRNDPTTSFSIRVPESWSVETKQDGHYGELLAKSDDGCEITIFASSRPLSTAERSETPRRLLDAMLNSSLDHLRSEGHEVVDVGKYREFKQGWPAFVIVSMPSSGEQMALSYGSVIEDRNLSVLALAEQEQHSEDLAEIVRSVVDSLEVH